MEYINNFKKDLQEFLNGFKQMGSDLVNKERRIKQVPNLITLSRLLIASFIPSAAISGNLVLAAVLTIAAASTDGIDGIAARKLNATSEFGKNLDPVCDKFFAAILTVPLMIKLPAIASIGLGVNLVLEAGIAGINLKSKAKGNNPRTTWLGKIKTALLSSLLAAFYISFSHEFNPAFIPTLYALTTTLQTLTCINYQKIDKQKDKEKEILSTNQTTNHNEETQTQQTKTKTIEQSKETFTISDYQKLKEELTAPKEDLEKDKSIDNGFQKTKK